VSIRLGRAGQRLFCDIGDDGVGFDVGALEARETFSLGLIVIKDRIEAVGGTLTIASSPDEGTHLHATAPLEA
jgi:signal transduction histidine kinase